VPPFSILTGRVGRTPEIREDDLWLQKRRSWPVQIVRTKKANDSAAITPVEYGGLQAAFDYLNTKPFEGALPNIFISGERIWEAISLRTGLRAAPAIPRTMRSR
jgi:hypothetical protein